MNYSNTASRFLILSILLIGLVSITSGCNHSNENTDSKISEQVSVEEATGVLNQAVAYASERKLE